MPTVALSARAPATRVSLKTTILATVAYVLAVVVVCKLLSEYGVSLPSDGEMPIPFGP